MRPLIFGAFSLLFGVSLPAQIDWTAPLPPLEPWSGKSQELIVDPDSPWATPFEKSGLKRSPNYEETVAWLRKLVTAAPELEMVSLGKSAQGRDIWMVIASAERAFTPEKLKRSGKPTVLAQAGIHSGEIDGKDAGMMLLRDMTVRGERKDLLRGANLLFIPILSPDAHERSGPFHRMNQRGPEEMGWRTSATNLNLNRDYTKIDLEETRAVIGAINRWSPHLYLDLHVTDGEDYQYDITFGFNGSHSHSPAIGKWLETAYRGSVDAELERMGHVPGPLVFTVNGLDLREGIVDWTAPPRFSSGYGDARHLPTVLLENHSLKPFDRRVLGTYVYLEASMRVAAARFEELEAAIAADRQRDPETFPLDWAAGSRRMIDFAGIESRFTVSPVTGKAYVQWTGRPQMMQIPHVILDEVAAEIERPAAWWIPAEWRDVIERLRIHGIEMEEIERPREVRVEMLRLGAPTFDAEPFEGRVRVSATSTPEPRTETFPAGSVRVPADQPLADLAALLLEPRSPDSFLQWGFFHSIFSRTEYAEAYVMEPLAERMLEDPEVREAYERRLSSDEAFRNDADARLNWFYERTPYFDPRWRLYPVGREPRSR